MHAMAVKYGGKYVDLFLKGKIFSFHVAKFWRTAIMFLMKIQFVSAFDFLQAQFQAHNELIIQMVRRVFSPFSSSELNFIIPQVMVIFI